MRAVWLLGIAVALVLAGDVAWVRLVVVLVAAGWGLIELEACDRHSPDGQVPR